MTEVQASKTVSDKPLYSPDAIFWATVLGGIFPGALLMSWNYRRLGMPVQAYDAIMTGLFFTVAVSIMMGFVPEFLIFILINFALAFVMAHLAVKKQQAMFLEHVENGGEKASVWFAAGFGFLVGLGVWAVSMVVVFLGVVFLVE